MTNLEIVDAGNITVFITAIVEATRALFGEVPYEMMDEVITDGKTRCVSIHDGESHDTGDSDLYDIKSECFIEGVKLAVQAEEGDAIFTAYTDDDAGFDAQYTFWFLAKSEGEVIERLRQSFKTWAEAERKERGVLIPVPDLGPPLDARQVEICR